MADWPFNSTLDGIDGDKDVQTQWKLLKLNILMPGWDCPKPSFFEESPGRATSTAVAGKIPS